MYQRITDIEEAILDLASHGPVTNDALVDLVPAGESHLISSALHNLLAQRLVVRRDDGTITLA